MIETSRTCCSTTIKVIHRWRMVETKLTPRILINRLLDSCPEYKKRRRHPAEAWCGHPRLGHLRFSSAPPRVGQCHSHS
ncbi:rCG56146 [Rattus norvegicus]|uniref:RCG56146 n=1 Tax=Rattus norvegicus TaxID=10116 RepID=A6IBQ7_RAT|nr:rCG56146 [Rattus norvegicus]